MSALSEEEAQEIVGALDEISRPILDREVMRALAQSGEIHYDGDLTGRVVSNTSTTYPGAAFGHMGDAVSFGYQAAMVSFHSLTFGRFWLSSALHPGDAISCTQAAAMVRAAEAKTGMRPLRRTDLLAQRIQQVAAQCQKLETQIGKMSAQQQAIHTRLMALPSEIEEWQQKIDALKDRPPQPGRRPSRQIAQAQTRVQKLRRRQERLTEQLAQLRTRLVARQTDLDECRCLEQTLQSRLECFEQDNQLNAFPFQPASAWTPVSEPATIWRC